MQRAIIVFPLKVSLCGCTLFSNKPIYHSVDHISGCIPFISHHIPQKLPLHTMKQSLVGGFNPSENISQLGSLFPLYGKIKCMFQTTNQSSLGIEPRKGDLIYPFRNRWPAVVIGLLRIWASWKYSSTATRHWETIQWGCLQCQSYHPYGRYIQCLWCVYI